MYQNARAERLSLLIKPKAVENALKTFDGADKLSKEEAEGILHFIRRNDLLALLPTIMEGVVVRLVTA